MLIDRLTLKQAFLTGFRPKEKDIDTPYLVLPDGTTLDGKLKLHGITGKESLEIRQACMVNGTIDDAKLSGKLACKCLYLRAVDGLTGETISDGNTPFLDPTDEMAFLDLGLDTFNELGGTILRFVGMAKESQEEAKKNSQTDKASEETASSSPHVSTEPSMNSLPELIPQN